MAGPHECQPAQAAPPKALDPSAQLALADRYIVRAEAAVAHQRRVVERLKEDGRDAAKARGALQTLCGILSLMNDFREATLREIAASERRPRRRPCLRVVSRNESSLLALPREKHRN